MEFQTFGFDPELLKVIGELSFTRPTPVQERAMGPIMRKQNVLAVARPETGRTTAFLLPVIHRLITKDTKDRGVKAVVIAPSNAALAQTVERFQELSRKFRFKHAVLGAGEPVKSQAKTLSKGVEIIFATPGRLVQHLHESSLELPQLESIVFDNTDRCLAMGLMPECRQIISFLPPERQNLIFTSHAQENVRALARALCREYATVDVTHYQNRVGVEKHGDQRPHGDHPRRHPERGGNRPPHPQGHPRGRGSSHRRRRRRRPHGGGSSSQTTSGNVTRGPAPKPFFTSG